MAQDAAALVAELSGAPTMGRLKRLSYTHEALVDLIISQPELDQNHLAAHFGYTPAWISNILASDAFKAQLARRRDEIVDPELRATVKERMEGLLIRSVKVLMQKLEQPMVPDNLALRAAELGAKSLGLGIAAPQVQITTGTDRLERLAERLIVLQQNVRQGVTFNGEVLEAQPAALPGEQGRLPAWEGGGSEPPAGQPVEAAVRADGEVSGSAAL